MSGIIPSIFSLIIRHIIYIGPIHSFSHGAASLRTDLRAGSGIILLFCPILTTRRIGGRSALLSHPDTSALLLSVASAPSAAVRMSSLSIFSIIRRLQAIRIINPEARNQKKASAAPAADASLKERGHAILIEGIAASATCSSYRNVLRNGS